MITAHQLRAARALLNIDQRQMAGLAELSVPTIQRMEASDGVIRANVDSLMKLVSALESAGIELINPGVASSIGRPRRTAPRACRKAKDRKPSGNRSRLRRAPDGLRPQVGGESATNRNNLQGVAATCVHPFEQRKQTLQHRRRRRRAAGNVEIDRDHLGDAAHDRVAAGEACLHPARSRRSRPPIWDWGSRDRCAPAPRACSWSPDRSPSARRHGAARRRSAARSVRRRNRRC